MPDRELEITIEVTCTQPPAPDAVAGGTLHVGIQSGKQVVGLTPVNRKPLIFRPTVRASRSPDGSPNFLGPYSQGPRAERFIYLNWALLSDREFVASPGRIKLHLSHIPWDAIEAAARTGKPIRVSLALSDANGKLVFASIRKDRAKWVL